MLAPFVLNLLIACSLVLLVGWTGDTISTWVGAVRRSDTREAQRIAESRRRIDRCYSDCMHLVRNERGVAVENRPS